MVLIEKEINGKMLNRDSLVEVHKGLVHKVCQKFSYRAEKLGMEYEDIASVGFIGLIKAFENFDSEKYDVRFSTYAIPMVTGEIKRAFRDSNPGVKYSRSIKDIAYQILLAELEDESADIISLKLGASKENVIYALNFILHGTPSSLDEPLFNETASSEVTRSDLVGTNDDSTSLFVNEFIESLPHRERVIVNKLTDGFGQKEIGELIGVSQVQVSRLLNKIRESYLNFIKRDVEDMRKPKGDLNKAKQLLLEGTMHVSEIAELTGTNISTLNNYKYSWKKKEQVKPIQNVAIKENSQVVETTNKTNTVIQKKSIDLNFSFEIGSEKTNIQNVRPQIELLLNMLEGSGASELTFKLSVSNVASI